MTLLVNEYGDGVRNMPEAQGGEVLSVRLKYSLAAALALDDVIHLGFLPAGHTMVDCYIDSDELDTGADAIDLEVGILNAAKDNIDDTASGGAPWTGADDTIGQAGGLSRATGSAIARVVSSAITEQAIGIHITTAPGTGATTGDVALTVSYRATAAGE